MKKLLILTIAFMLSGVAANAQTYTMKSVYGNSTDSVTNAGNNYLKTTAVSGEGAITVQLVVTKLSGTAAGTAVIQGSLDGTNWVNINYATGGQTGAMNDTFALTDVTSQTYAWFLPASPYIYYRVYVVGSGTQLIRLAATLIKRT